MFSLDNDHPWLQHVTFYDNFKQVCVVDKAEPRYALENSALVNYGDSYIFAIGGMIRNCTGTMNETEIYSIEKD